MSLPQWLSCFSEFESLCSQFAKWSATFAKLKQLRIAMKFSPRRNLFVIVSYHRSIVSIVVNGVQELILDDFVYVGC